MPPGAGAAHRLIALISAACIAALHRVVTWCKVMRGAMHNVTCHACPNIVTPWPPPSRSAVTCHVAVLLIIHTLHADACHTVYMESCRSRLRVNSSMIQWVAGYRAGIIICHNVYFSKCDVLIFGWKDWRVSITGVHHNSAPLQRYSKHRTLL